jgi:hypothetical protein
MTDEFITVEEAAERLQVSTRQVHRYGEAPAARIRTRKAGRRKLFNKADVEVLAADLNVEDKPKPVPKAELMPASDLLHYIRERDQQLADVQQQLNRAMLEIGRLQGQLEAANERIRQLEAPAESHHEQAVRGERGWWSRLLLRWRK